MPSTYSAAADEVQSIVKSVWDTLSAAFTLGYTPEIRWPGVENANKLDRAQFSARVSIQNVVGEQIAFGSKKFRDVNLLYVQVFCPRNVANSLVTGRQIAELIRTAFCQASPSGNLWFRDQKIRELAPEADFYPINVVATFEYETIQ
jgi:hypothetical protein